MYHPPPSSSTSIAASPFTTSTWSSSLHKSFTKNTGYSKGNDFRKTKGSPLSNLVLQDVQHPSGCPGFPCCHDHPAFCPDKCFHPEVLASSFPRRSTWSRGKVRDAPMLNSLLWRIKHIVEVPQESYTEVWKIMYPLIWTLMSMTNLVFKDNV